MRAHYDPQVDALSIRWSEAPIVESDAVEAGVILHYDQDGSVIKVEVLNASKKIQYLSSLPVSQL